MLSTDIMMAVSCLSTSNTGCVASKWHHYISLLHYNHTTCDIKTAYSPLNDCEMLPTRIAIAITATIMRMLRVQLTLQSVGASSSLTTLD